VSPSAARPGSRRPPVPRRDYEGRPLDETTFPSDPFAAFAGWFDDAVARGVPEPDAVCVSTVDADGVVSSRMVLLKSWDARGFVFATNGRSRKASDLAATGRAALTFRWALAERQVNVVGTARRVSRAESDEIFAARPRGAQLAAWTSRQSSVVADRAALDAEFDAVSARFEACNPVPRPPHWGGWRVAPETVEFWQGRTNRMHDRLRYRRSGRRWVLERLAP
jgi:pyridoxamine 5'-phosphate oxidase